MRWGIARATALVGALSFASAACADGLVIFGSHREGGAANAFQTIVDLSDGHERTIIIHGESAEESGFDGRLWNFVNGAPNRVDLPSAVADQRAKMWIRQKGFRTLGKPGESQRRVSVDGLSPIDLTFDPATRRVSQAIVHGEYGPVIMTFGDWRRVGPYDYPFRQQLKDDEGEQVDLAKSVRVIRTVPASLLSAPAKAEGAHLASIVVTIPFTATGRSKTHLLVPATVDGQPTSFVFDTGGANILTTDAAKRFSIASSGGMNIGGVGEGSETGGFGLVNHVAIGGAELADQSFVIVPSFFPPENGKPSPIAGLLGYEFLAHFVTTIDYRAETITFRSEVPADQRGVRLPFFSDGHGIAVEASINGKPGLVSFDTGDGGTLTLFPAFTESHRLDTGTAEATSSGGGVGGAVKATSGTLNHFTVGGLDFPNLPVSFSKNGSGAFASRFLAGNLGGLVLRCFRITFDFPHHLLWLEPQPDTPLCAANTKAPV
jgi:hypothetical protein